MICHFKAIRYRIIQEMHSREVLPQKIIGVVNRDLVDSIHNETSLVSISVWGQVDNDRNIINSG